MIDVTTQKNERTVSVELVSRRLGKECLCVPMYVAYKDKHIKH